MKPEHWQQLDKLFHAALERAPEERAAFLDEACSGDGSLRKQVEALLAAHEAAGSFIESPAMEVEARGVAADPENKEEELATGETVSHYRIISLLGSGGMGDVYLAHDTVLSRQVALKLLPAEFTRDTGRVRRFQQEARAASALNHPNIVTIHEIGQFDERHFIATEFIDGPTLRQHISGSDSPTAADGSRASGRHLKLGEILSVAIQTADALSAAHEASIVHRDIKPENIMLRRRDRYVKVLDFGLAKLTGGAVDTEAPTRAQVQTSAGVVMGTVNYMSPEQARGEQVDARTDIWSLGVVLYEMVAGCAPFERASQNEVLASILDNKEPPPLARYSREAPAELDRIVNKALTKDRDERYQTAKDLLVDLRRLRQRIEVEAEIERTAEPHAVATASEQTAAATLRAATTVATGDAAVAHSTSVVKETLLHKRGVLIVLAAFVAVTAVAAYFAYSRYWAEGGRANIDSTVGIRSIAVLPFTNATGNPDTEYLSDGIAESLINSLSQLPSVKVIARSSSFTYKGKEVDPQEVSRALGVEGILTGRVEQRGENLLISVELMDASDRTHVWGEQYNRKATDLPAVQWEISRAIAARLRLKLTNAEQQQLARRQTVNPQAYELLLKARFYNIMGGAENLKKTIEYLNQAIAIDPAYAPAYAELSGAYWGGVHDSYLDPTEGRPKAEAAALKALELDAGLAGAHLAMAGIKRNAWEWPAAEREYQQAIDLNPNLAEAHHGYAVYLSLMGRHEQAIAEMKSARELDPRSLGVNLGVGARLSFARYHDQSIEALKKTLELDQNYAAAHIFLGYNYAAKEMYPEAIASYQRFIKLSGDDSSVQISLGIAYARAGQRAKARAILKRLHTTKEYVSPGELATLYAALGEREQAFASLEKAFLEHDIQLGGLGVVPEYDPLRSDPRFADLMRRVGLTP